MVSTKTEFDYHVKKHKPKSDRDVKQQHKEEEVNSKDIFKCANCTYESNKKCNLKRQQKKQHSMLSHWNSLNI